MRDDVLGAFGETSATGKPVGDDLREGKPTPLMAIAVARANGAQQSVLAQVGAARLDDAQVASVQQVIVDTGALAELEATIARLTDEAVAAITAAPVSSQVRSALVELAAYVVQRSL
jgi:geranylgeranyl diphosphate synthase type I